MSSYEITDFSHLICITIYYSLLPIYRFIFLDSFIIFDNRKVQWDEINYLNEADYWPWGRSNSANSMKNAIKNEEREQMCYSTCKFEEYKLGSTLRIGIQLLLIYSFIFPECILIFDNPTVKWEEMSYLSEAGYRLWGKSNSTNTMKNANKRAAEK